MPGSLKGESSLWFNTVISSHCTKNHPLVSLTFIFIKKPIAIPLTVILGRSVIEEHAAGCPGLCDTSLGEETTDRPTCPLCGQRFSRDKLEQHSQYCGEVAV